MNILITNDDGIEAKGLKVLVRMAQDYFKDRLPEGGDLAITVCAPLEQCSAMSHRITIMRPLEAFPREWDEDGSVTAWAVDGTPGDCVKAALGYLMEQKPDVVFSGINEGYNVGQDILYSGTVGAAMEALIQGIPAIAFSIGRLTPDYEIFREFTPVILDALPDWKGDGRHILNINFPETWDRDGWAAVRELPAGDAAREAYLRELIAWDCGIEKGDFFRIDSYRGERTPMGSIRMFPVARGPREGTPGTDIRAVREGRIAVGWVRNEIL